MDRQQKWFDRILENFGALLVLAIIVVTSMQVVFRYVLQSPLSWSEESARYLLIWLAMIGSVMAMQTNEHIVIELFVEKLSPQIKLIHKFIYTFFVFSFLGIIAYFGYSFAVMNGVQTSSAMPWLSMFWACIAIPIGALLMIGYLIKNLANEFPKLRNDFNNRGESEL